MLRQGKNPEAVLGKIQEFVLTTPNAGVNNFVLQGPVNVPTEFDSFAGVFPRNRELAIVAPGPDRTRIPRRILEVQVPERVQMLRIRDDDEVRVHAERLSISLEQPSIVMGFGRARDTGQEVVVLWSITGLSPERALKKIQNIVRTGIRELER